MNNGCENKFGSENQFMALLDLNFCLKTRKLAGINSHRNLQFNNCKI
jgi:hypothetical protein